MPTALILRTAGTNCDEELARAFELAGAQADRRHVDALATDPSPIRDADLIAFPGGFSYGDDVASGRLLALRCRERLWPALREAAARGTPMIGVCNGFQVMTQAGLLPGPEAGRAWPEDAPEPTVALADNASARFVDRWVRLRVEPGSSCLWTRPLVDLPPERCLLPIAHAEGRFVAPREVLDGLEASGRVALRYAEPVNGSARDIAGICDASGRIFGLMPHPERYTDHTRHPCFTRLGERERSGDTPGLAMFRAAVEAVRAGAAV
ncbi:MAG: phosphoribosylformylglycinamidine synthase subunit PurQ [Phycisphaerales bacterium]|nr:MAG: phosphoribosylformylglycinamidine synthase subunit PurQ [Phycisphaerales bacterium]